MDDRNVTIEANEFTTAPTKYELIGLIVSIVTSNYKTC